MSKENLTMFEQVIDSEKGEEKEFYLKGLKDMIGKLEKDADEGLKKEISRLKSKFSIGGAKKSPAKKSPAKKPTAKKTPKAKPTAEEKAEKKERVSNATGKTIEECKEILAKYEAMRLKTNKEQTERITDLKKKDEIIDGTNVKTADATTKTTAKDVAPKIKKEVEQIEKDAEKEAIKKVKPQGKKPKGKTEKDVKQEVEKEKIKIIEEKVEDMTKDLASASANFVKSVQSEIAKFSKDDAKKFLIDLRKQIDVLLRAYGYGGELSAGLQGYEIPWAGGSGRPTPLYAKGGNVSKDLGHLIYVSNLNNPNPNKELVAMVKAKGDAIIIKSALQENVVEAPLEYTMESKFAKGGKFADGGERDVYFVDWTNKTPLVGELEDKYLLGNIWFSFNKDRVIQEAIHNKHIHNIVIIKGNEGYNAYAYNPDTFNPLDFGGTKMFAKGGEVLTVIAEDWGRDSDIYYALQDSYVAYDSDEKAKEVLEEYDMLEDYEHLFAKGGSINHTSRHIVIKERIAKIDNALEGYTDSDLSEDLLREKTELENELKTLNYAKGGKTRSTHSRRVDARRLSQEPWEQAYKPKRKGDYYEDGGEVEKNFKERIRIQADKQGKTYSEEQIEDIYQRYRINNKKMNLPYAKGGGVDKYVLPKNLKKKLDKVNQHLNKFGGRSLTEKEAIRFNIDNNAQSGFEAGSIAFDISEAPDEYNGLSWHRASSRYYHLIGDSLIEISEEMTNVPYDSYDSEIIKQIKGTEYETYAKGGKTNWVDKVVDSPNFDKGAFSRKAEARGMSSEAFMNQVLHNPSYYDEKTVKQAQFMKNAFNM